MQQVRAIKSKKLKTLVNCKFCNKGFSKESTLSVHLCEPARRANQRNDTGVQFGYRVWIKFLEQNTTKKNLTYEEFCTSPYYSAFVKFGQYLIQIRCINVEEFSKYILSSKIKIDNWTKDEHYNAWMLNYVKKESATAAIERSIKTMTAWAEENNSSFEKYFTVCSSNRIVKDVVDGRVSPWAIYQSASGKEFLSNINEEQLGILFPFIDPAWWTSRFSNLIDDVEFVKMVCKNGGF